MSLLKLSYYGLSGVTWLATFLCGVAARVVWESDTPFSIKAVSACLLLLMSLMVFVYDNEMAFLESAQN